MVNDTSFSENFILKFSSSCSKNEFEIDFTLINHFLKNMFELTTWSKNKF